MTQEQKILALMLHTPDRWWKASDFMRHDIGEYFVGYEASARLSELAADYPWIETKKDGRFKLRKLNQDLLRTWLENGFFDDEMQQFIIKYAKFV